MIGDPSTTGERPTDWISISALICSATCCAAPVGLGLGIGALASTAALAAATFLVVTSADDMRVEDAHVGQCVDVDWGGAMSRADCSEPHDAEVIWVGRFDAALAEEWDRTSYIDEFCLGRDLAEHHRAVAESGELVVDYTIDDLMDWEPQEGSWLACFLIHPDGDELDEPVAELGGSTGA